jgi:ferrous iron transport protein B
MKKPVILIIGPNYAGKTTFFHSFVERRSIKTMFYPGTRTKILSGETVINKQVFEVIDSPGITNLLPTSENELITMKIILEKMPEKIIFVTNEENMQQNILLFIQLAELGIPFIINFYRRNDFQPAVRVYDHERMGSIFKTKIIHTIPLLKKGLKNIKKEINQSGPPRWVGSYHREAETLIKEVETELKTKLTFSKSLSSRFTAIMLIFKNQAFLDWLKQSGGIELWQKINQIISRNKNNASTRIGEQWAETSSNLLREITVQGSEYKPQYLTILNKYTLQPLWDLAVLLIVLYLYYQALIWIGTKFLVNIIYVGLFSTYIEPFIQNLAHFIFGYGFISDYLVGPYGVFNIAIMYSLAVILPTIFVFYFIFVLLDESAYLPRISLTLNRFMQMFGLNGFSVPQLMTGASCKILALFKTKILDSKRERTLVFMLLLFGIPCVSQLSIISNLLSIIPMSYRYIYLLVIFLQLVGLAAIFNTLHKKSPAINYFAIKLTPLRIPNLNRVFKKTISYLTWYIKELIPLLVLAATTLFLLNSTGLLEKISDASAPFFSHFLTLPKQFAEALLLGFFRKDIGAVHLYDLANNGMLNSIQVLVSLTFISLTFPCLGFYFALYKEKGFRYSTFMFLASTSYAFTLAYILNKILRV